MTDIWKEREKAFENEYFYKLERKQIEKLRADAREKVIREECRNRCPKCGEPIVAITFRDVPLDKCPACGGVWLGPQDFRLLATKDHRTWFDKWFLQEAKPLDDTK